MSKSLRKFDAPGMLRDDFFWYSIQAVSITLSIGFQEKI